MIHDYIFDSNIEKLKEVFGDRYFTDSRKQLIWESVKDLSDDWFRNKTDFILSTFKNPPLPFDFREMVRQEHLKSGSAPERIGECKKCDGYGSYLKEVNGYKFGFRCNCIAGPKLAGGLPLEFN